MTNRRLSLRKIEEVLRLHFECGRNNREIAQSVQVSPTTVGDYLRRAKLAGIGWPVPAGMTELALEARLFPSPPSSKVKRPEPDWSVVHRGLGRKGVTLDCSGRNTGSSILTATSSRFRPKVRPEIGK